MRADTAESFRRSYSSIASRKLVSQSILPNKRRSVAFARDRAFKSKIIASQQIQGR
jgi:hypothetical protein